MIRELKILICDDSLIIRRTLRDILDEIGCKKIYEAVNGVDAIEKYKEIDPDLVFMDIIMPKKSGVEALVEIKKFDEKANVVVVSSALTQKYVKAAISAGASEFIQKPISIYQIQKIIDRL